MQIVNSAISKARELSSGREGGLGLGRTLLMDGGRNEAQTVYKLLLMCRHAAYFFIFVKTRCSSSRSTHSRICFRSLSGNFADVEGFKGHIGPLLILITIVCPATCVRFGGHL